MANLGDFFTGGYFQVGAEERFPWDASSGGGVWYALFTTTGAVGYTSSLTDKKALIDAIECQSADGKLPMLIGIWTGQYNTSLFPLDPRIASEKIRSFLANHEQEKIRRAETARAQREADRIRAEETKAALKRAEQRIAEANKTKPDNAIKLPTRDLVEEMKDVLFARKKKPGGGPA